MGRPIPERIANAPTVAPENEIFWLAFHDLTGSRPWIATAAAASPLPIPWRDVSAYANAMGADDLLRDEMHYCIAEMDSVYLKWHSKKAHKK
jgi:hypothetical protein